MADAVTVLSPGSGGDSMDESLVNQTSVSNVKRPRVVLGGDTGYDGTNNDLVQPTRVDPGPRAGV